MRVAIGFLWLLPLLLGGCQAATVPVRPAGSPAPSVDPAKPGQAVAGLSAEQLATFERGKFKFSRLFTPSTGLGPLYNDNSCRACHGTIASGGHSERSVTLVGAMIDGGPSLLLNEGGPMIQAFAVAGTPQDQVPKDATSLSHRISPPVWGVGLVEAVPESTIVAQMLPSDEKLALGIRGIANWEGEKLGRFGDKAQKSDMVSFTQQAYAWEMGLSTPGRLEKPRPDLPALIVTRPDIPQDDFDDVVAYQRFLDAPPRGPITPAVERGSALFATTGCVQCHVPSLTTGPNTIGIPEGRSVGAFSDYLVHVMDDTMADQMTQGQAGGQMFRTSPLWGLRFRELYMHDGRATTLDDAIALHGGEASLVRDRALALSTDERAALIAFLKSL